MFDLIATKILDAAISVAKDILKGRIDERNKINLEKKKRREERKKTPLIDISKITLDPDEIETAEIEVSSLETYDALKTHLGSVRQWAESVGFTDLKGTKYINEIYIHLDTYLTPTRLHLSASEKLQTKPLEDAVFGWKRHCVILGQPGAGKTTSMKKLCFLLLNHQLKSENYTFPLLLRFRDLPKTGSAATVIIDELAKIFPLQFQFGGALQTQNSSKEALEYKQSTLRRFIDEICPMIILDGFDEYPDIANRSQVAEEIRALALTFTKAKLIITSRVGEFSYSIESTQVFEIAPLKEKQIEDFAHKWLSDHREAGRFLDKLCNSPFADTAIKPLSLAHLCAIFERTGTFPDRPKTVYRKVVGLLLEEWDQQRSVKRYSKYAKFEPDRKFEFLCNLSFYFTTVAKSAIFSREMFIAGYKSIYANFGLDESQSELVAAEIESHTGLFLQSGYEQYEFIHKSIQEYLAAEYIVKLPSIPSDQTVVQGLGAEMAIAVSISSNPSLYFSEFVLNVLIRVDLPPAFYDAFVNRILQEKPDFYENEIVIVAFFNLLTMWANRGRISSFRIHDSQFSADNYERYHQLLTLVQLKNSANILSRYYAIEYSDPLRSGLVHIKRRKNVGEHRALPYILMPAEFFDGIKSTISSLE